MTTTTMDNIIYKFVLLPLFVDAKLSVGDSVISVCSPSDSPSPSIVESAGPDVGDVEGEYEGPKVGWLVDDVESVVG